MRALYQIVSLTAAFSAGFGAHALWKWNEVDPRNQQNAVSKTSDPGRQAVGSNAPIRVQDTRSGRTIKPQDELTESELLKRYQTKNTEERRTAAFELLDYYSAHDPDAGLKWL